MGMRYSASTFTGALRIASSGLPRGFGGGALCGHARALAHRLRVGHVLLRVVGDFDEARRVPRLLVRLGDDEGHGLGVEKDSVGLERPERLVLLFLGARGGASSVEAFGPSFGVFRCVKTRITPAARFGLARVDRL